MQEIVLRLLVTPCLFSRGFYVTAAPNLISLLEKGVSL